MSRIRPLRPGESQDQKVNDILTAARDGWFNDTNMFGLIGRRPELLKAIVPVFEAIFGKSTIDPYLFELMRLKTGEKNKCAYCATVRVADLKPQVQAKESAVLGDIDKSKLTEQEALVVELAEKMVLDPNAIDDQFFARLKWHFNENQIVELVFAAAVFNFGNKFNITMRLDTAKESPYGSILEKGLTYPYEPALAETLD